MMNDEVRTADFADVTGIPLKEVRRLANDGVVIKAKRRGYVKFSQSVQGVLRNFSTTDAELERETLKQEKLDRGNDLREHQIQKERGALIPFIEVVFAKKSYIVGVVKMHVTIPPLMRRQFPGIEKTVVEFCEEQLTEIRENIKADDA